MRVASEPDHRPWPTGPVGGYPRTGPAATMRPMTTIAPVAPHARARRRSPCSSPRPARVGIGRRDRHRQGRPAEHLGARQVADEPARRHGHGRLDGEAPTAHGGPGPRRRCDQPLRVPGRETTPAPRADTDRDGKGDGDDREDPDKDGLTNKSEQTRGTHPRKADTDGDGYRDGTEVRAGTNPTQAPASRPAVTAADPAAAPPTDSAGRPGLPDLPGRQRLERPHRRPRRGLELGHDDLVDRPDARAAHGLRVVRRLRHPVQRRDGDDAAARRVTFDYDDESDHVPYPIPASPKIEGGSDRHILMVDKDACRLYELFAARKVDGAWHAGSGATWDLRSNALRTGRLDQRRRRRAADPARASSATTRSRAGAIDHALRFTTDQTRTLVHLPGPPPGRRLDARRRCRRWACGSGSRRPTTRRGFSPQARVIADALKRYGMILADNGSPWYITGRQRPALRRRRHARARRHHRPRPRGRRHDRAGQRAVAPAHARRLAHDRSPEASSSRHDDPA